MIGGCEISAIARNALVILSACLFAAGAHAQQPTSGSQRSEPPARFEYRSISFSARRIDCEDPRFLVAEAGFPFVWGFRLNSRDPALYSIAWYDGLMMSGALRDGRAIVFHFPIAVGAAESEIRVARTADLAGGWLPAGGRDEAPSHPEIPGYRFVMSDNVIGTRDYLGLWRRIHGEPETLIVSFRPIVGIDLNRYSIVGRMPLRVGSISVHSPAHGVSWGVDLVSEAQVGHPLYVVHYEWFPAYFLRLPGTASGDPREICRMLQASPNRGRP